MAREGLQLFVWRGTQVVCLAVAMPRVRMRDVWEAQRFPSRLAKYCTVRVSTPASLPLHVALTRAIL